METQDGDAQNWDALIRVLASLIALVIGFRVLNIVYLLIPIWVLTGYETFRRREHKVNRAKAALANFLSVTILLLLAYAFGRLCGWLAS
jgi:hypothetical protein